MTGSFQEVLWKRNPVLVKTLPVLPIPHEGKRLLAPEIREMVTEPAFWERANYWLRLCGMYRI